MADESILNVDRLCVTLDEVEILHDVSFHLNQGEAVAVIGPNGAGKTVMFRALLRLLPHTGTVVWQPGIKIGYVPQRFTVDRSAPITAMEFFLLQSRRFWRPPSSFITHVDEELKLVGLDKTILKKTLGELSGGQTQRVLIAWALLGHPDVLLLDEPTAGVDMGFEHSIYELLHKIQTERGTALLLISHDLNVVYRYAQHVVCLNKTVVCQGRPTETLNANALSALYGESGYYLHDHVLEH
jgi:zinc transport system ATP-binding protein